MGNLLNRKRRKYSFSIVLLIMIIAMSNVFAFAIQAEADYDEVVFVEDNLTDYRALVNSVKPGMQVYVLDSRKDGLAQMADILNGKQDIDAIHLLSHGAEGKINLGSLLLSKENIGDNSGKLRTIGKALKKDGDMLVYGCDVAKGKAGAELVTELAAMSGADVAASEDKTGAEEKAGDWGLERETGKIETAALVFYRYEGTMDNYNIIADTESVTLTDGVADKIIFPSTYGLSGGGYWQPDNLQISSVTVVSGFNAAEDKIDLSNTLLTPSAVFDMNFADNTNEANIYGTDEYYTTYGYGSLNGRPFSISGDVLGAGGANTGILVGYTDETNWMADFVFFQGTTGTITASNFILPGMTNVTPAFIGATTSLSVNQDSEATDIRYLLHVSDSDLGQTLIWSQATGGAPSHGTLSFSGTSASSGSMDITPGGTITYTPTAGYSGPDSFKVQVSDGTDTTIRTISVTVNDTTAPKVSGIVRQTPSAADTNADSVIFRVTFDETVSGVDIGDFTLTTTGTAAGTIASVSLSSGTTIDVTVNNITGDGTLRLDLKSAAAGATIKDASDNSLVEGYTIGQAYTMDNQAPEVSSVSVSSNGTYTAGQNLDFTVNFSETVTVNTAGGTPYIALTLNTGGTVKASYVSGTGTSILVFRYTVVAGNEDLDGITAAAGIAANGGTLRDAVGNDAVLTLDSAGSTEGVLVDAIAPTVSSVSVPANATYTAGQNLDFTVNFSENVTVNTGGGTPYIALTLSTGGTVNAGYASGSGTSALVFRYTVVSGNADSDGISAGGAISANGGTLKDAAGNIAALTLNSVGSTTGVLVDAKAPEVSSVSVPSNGTYTAGQNLDFTVNFSENVTVNTGGGTPYITLTLSTGGSVNASYLSGSGTSALVFRYTVAAGNEDMDGIVLDGAIEANGAVFEDAAHNAAALALSGAGATVGILVDAVQPSIDTAVLTSSNAYVDLTFTEGIYGANDGATALTASKLVLTFTKNGGSASSVVIDSIKKSDGVTGLSGGETAVRVFLSITGTPSGTETIEIKPANVSSIYDHAGNSMAAAETTGVIALVDKAAPIAGDGGTISAGEGATAIDLAWTAAADTKTAQDNLQYKIVCSSLNDIDTVDNAEANGTTVMDWTSGIGSFQVSGLSQGTTYYFNIIVKDEAGNKAVYTTVTKTTTIAEIDVKGNGVSIADGDATPGSSDYTDFGNADISTGMVERSFIIENTGTGLLGLTGTPRISISGANAADFTVTQEPAESIAAGGSTSFRITFDPAVTGLRAATVSIDNDDIDEDPYNFDIQGTGTAAPEIDVKGNGNSIADGDTTPAGTDDTDFGSTDIAGGMIVKTFTIENSGSAGIVLTGMPKVEISGANAADFTVTQQPEGTIAAVGSTSFQVAFDPSAEGTRTAIISIANNDSDESPYDFSIKGTGSVAPEINITGSGESIADGDITPAANDGTEFGNADISGGTVERAFIITNTGSGVLSLGGTPRISISGANAADFTVTAEPEAVVAASASTTFRITFNPAGKGERTAAVSITNSDSDENPYTFTIRGTGTDSTVPLPGGGGAITTGAIAASSIELDWAEAIDDGTVQDDLQYLVVYSASGNIDTVSNAVYNGTVIKDWTSNLTGATATGLLPKTTYYFNVVVRDEENNRSVYEMASAATIEAYDTVAPVAGGSGKITADNITASSMDLSWAKASDNKTAETDLKYMVVYSQNDDIDTVDNAIDNGLEACGWTADLTEYTAAGLDPDTTYYFNVIVDDQGGNMTVYESVYGTTLKSSDMILPIPGGGGAITASNATTSSIRLAWAEGSDDVTGTTNLKYKVVCSTSNNIGTVEDALANDTIKEAWTANLTSRTVTGLNDGTTYYFNVIISDEAGNKAIYTATSKETLERSKDRDDDKDNDRKRPDSGVGSSDTKIIINDKVINAGKTTTEKVGDKTVTTVTVDDEMIEEKLEAEGDNATIVIPVNNGSNAVIGVLNGQTVKNMETKAAILKIETGNVTYTLPALEINIDSISEQLGQQADLKDIKISITIAEPSADTVKIVQDSANMNNYQIVISPLEFNITCTYGDKTVEVSKFNGYVERTIAIPDGIDPSKITTGIVLNSDGTFSHVPTAIVVIDGKYYAKINSLTNSTYSVIWSPKAFKDVEGHWAREAINDMGSRLVINGVDKENFAPDRAITRGEFASIIVKGLGLMRTGTGKNVYSDVNKTDWYYDAVYIANEYGLIQGTGSGQFEPGRKIKREEAMAIISRAMSITRMNTRLSGTELEKLLAGYSDGSEISGWAKESVALCIRNGIVMGSDRNIKPEENITRAEVAAIVRRLLRESNLI